jgi:hypothetical protein
MPRVHKLLFLFILDSYSLADLLGGNLSDGRKQQEVRALRERGAVEILHESGELRLLIWVAVASANSRVEIHVLRS